MSRHRKNVQDPSLFESDSEESMESPSTPKPIKKLCATSYGDNDDLYAVDTAESISSISDKSTVSPVPKTSHKYDLPTMRMVIRMNPLLAQSPTWTKKYSKQVSPLLAQSSTWTKKCSKQVTTKPLKELELWLDDWTC